MKTLHTECIALFDIESHTMMDSTLYTPEDHPQYTEPAKESSQSKNKRCNPEGVPLYSAPAVEPPLSNRTWFSFIEDLLEDAKSVMPKDEVLNLSFFRR
jgi:hypothetical protein